MTKESESKGKRLAFGTMTYAIVAILFVTIFGSKLPQVAVGLIGLSAIAAVFFAVASWKNRRIMR